ncbi:hypothetical protein GCM10011608_09550 [Micromonospora sonchi]|uniref:Uncharacterized protein n=1 Tax=Micromonospora sonchi TaxID=1763543 RepID=A0A917WTJ9_9ACTN|nr:hypothetical protein [Micromonospora sonchi]GGM26858.1 hypothetical protein GCM10011608_09550 [Micromonospora sonchi]
MPNKTLYIPDRDVPLWEAAQRVADRQKVSLYRVVSDALENHLPTAVSEPGPRDRWRHIAADQNAA